VASGLSVVLNCKRSLLRFVQSRHLSFRQSLPYLEQPSTLNADPAAVLERAVTFYQRQRDLYPEALCYLKQRGLHDPAQIKELRTGYAHGGSLRRHFTAQGYSFCLLQSLGLLNSQGCDAFYRASSSRAARAGRHQTLRPQYRCRLRPSIPAWEQVSATPRGDSHRGAARDYAVFRQEGFRKVTCTLGSHFNADQFLV
jgi:hypothetical protein